LVYKPQGFWLMTSPKKYLAKTLMPKVKEKNTYLDGNPL
jgi:hypothetical protein